MQIQINNRALELVEGDITELATDAIVNAANSALLLGAGVAGAIRMKGGPTIQQECSEIGHCPVGGAVITGSGELRAKHVIHAVGPGMGEGDEDNKLQQATLSSLKVADDNSLRSIALPALSTGVFGFPMERCAEIMLKTTKDYLQQDTGLNRVVFCLYGKSAFKVFKRALEELDRAA